MYHKLVNILNIVLATNNKHKAEEFLKIIDSTRFSIQLQNDVLNADVEVDETGATLEENAYLKAIQIFNLCQIPTISDDTGLEIEALDGAPGVYSARYAGEHGNDKANRDKVLQELDGVVERKARFRTVICFHDGVRTLFAEGICYGQIAHAEKGDKGFGYDSIFLPDGKLLSFAEMPQDEKNSISHRRKALDNLREMLERYLE